ncbi:vesicle-associated protein 2-2-like isoform X1 [Magnolia sinica]|uniref:vesicle-associated protein 2-2-like isoform X1 n=1 Tax=Magnolia sinica TaxID=86752 RepID=UPI002659841B|nr:vesicle-associated protein 2-2-like isoform X1 [Magnolia sinica]XP_058082274.1 vesicle-associated protein 2-2-like isoform X1 [Magnolia sinica]XP_058082275.1 vesicle-associated protein 2-2-like isoform X1 [Magnolia sinica]
MNPELLEIQPKELKFVFELKKQCHCSVQLVNNSDEYVAFKVKTTSPKKYSVRPNTGIVLPKSTCDFTVTMQAQQAAPPDIQCRDKFLIQSMVVPFGTTVEDITSSLFTKENGRYIEENKLKVILVSLPHSQVLLPINGALKQDPAHETSTLRDHLLSGDENLPPHVVVPKHVELAKDVEAAKDVELAKDVEAAKDAELAKDVEAAKEVEELKTKLNELAAKIHEAEKTVTSLTEERTTAIQARDMLQQELALARKKSNVQVRVGFPLLFVCLVALISVITGYFLHT